VPAARVTTPAEVGGAVDELLRGEHPFLVDLVINETVIA
jgi:hypothetical protein